MIYSFHQHELDTELYELRHADQRRTLQPLVFDLLLYLIEHSHRVVTRQELLDELWRGRLVCDSTLTHTVMQVRKVIDDSGSTQRLIRTVHGRGYRFVAPIGKRHGDMTPPKAHIATHGAPHSACANDYASDSCPKYQLQ